MADREALDNEPVENLVILYGELLIADGKYQEVTNHWGGSYVSHTFTRVYGSCT